MTFDEYFLEQIKNLVDGNNASKSDVKKCCSNIIEFDAYIFLKWNFEIKTNIKKISGAHPLRLHAKSSYEYNEYLDSLLKNNCINSKENFYLKQIQMNANEALRSADSSCVVYEFESVSCFESCDVCNGNGEVYCSSCGGNGRYSCSSCGGYGQENCRSCGGSGRQYNTLGERYESCSGCGGSGKISCYGCGGSGTKYCSSCGGSGKKTCNACDGSGDVTVIYTPIFQAIASATIRAQTKNPEFAELSNGFVDIVKSYKINELCKNLNFELVSHKKSDCSMTYKCSSYFTLLEYTIKERKYLGIAYGNPQTAYVRDPIFNDLLKDEINLCQQATKKISRNNSLKLYNRLQKISVLKKALEAPNITNSLQDMSIFIVNSTQKYIGWNESAILANGIMQARSKISPKYSSITYLISIIIFCIIMALFVVISFETGVKRNFTSIAIDIIISLISVVICARIWTWGTFAISYVITFLNRLRIKKSYRQPISHIGLYKKFLKTSLIVYIASFCYGLLANYDVLPKLSDKINKKTISDIVVWSAAISCKISNNYFDICKLLKK